MEDQQRCCIQEKDEQTLLPKEAHILYCVQQDVGDLLPVCGIECHLFCCCLLVGGSISVRDANRIYKLISKVENIIGQNLEAFESARVRGH